jgi:hypothetical protein
LVLDLVWVLFSKYLWSDVAHRCCIGRIFYLMSCTTFRLLVLLPLQVCGCQYAHMYILSTYEELIKLCRVFFKHSVCRRRFAAMYVFYWYVSCCVVSPCSIFNFLHRGSSVCSLQHRDAISLIVLTHKGGNELKVEVKINVLIQPTDSRPVCPDIRPPWGPVINISFSLKFSLNSRGFIIFWRPLWRESGSVIYYCCLASPTQSLSGLSPTGLKTIFYCSDYWDSPNLESQVPVFISPRNRVAQIYPRALGALSVASYDSQGYGGSILTLWAKGMKGAKRKKERKKMEGWRMKRRK